MSIEESLKALSEAAGVSSREDEVRSLLRDGVKDDVDELKTDALGNLICLKKPEGGVLGPRVMITAHMDEIGLMVTRIDKGGTLRFRPVGAIDERVIVSKSVLVGKNKVPGVIGGKPIHLQEADERKRPFRWESLYIDIGVADDRAAERLVKIGDLATFLTEAARFGEGLLKGKAFDDRVGCAVVRELLRGRYRFPLFAVFAVQEEVGLRGAATAAYGLDPDLALVFEGTSASDVPGSPPHLQSTTVGKGPAVTVMDASHITREPLLRRVLDVAGRNGIPVQLRRMNTGGTDAGKIALAREGVLAVTLSVPTRYIHSPVSIIHLADLAATVALAKAVLTSIQEEGIPL